VAEALHPEIRLKWPNDLWLAGDRKLGGILMETAAADAGPARFTIAGIGINIAALAAEGLATPPACLQELLPQVDAGECLLRITAPLVRSLQNFERSGFRAYQPRFNARDALAGRAVRLSDGATGTARGVNNQGALLVHTAAGVTAVTSAEVSVRPA
jgi:BirA family biotin operon repressor/biotin-[acetyl-CoA-carboxylase] ligase